MFQKLNILLKAFPNFNLVTFITSVEKNLTDCKTILDVGCGDNSPLRLFQGNYKTVGMDGYKKAIDISRRVKIHNKYIVGDIRKILTKVNPKSFDAVIALDVIEHLTKHDGYQFLTDIEKIAKKRIIIVTPNGFMVQKNNINNLQEHLSGWTVRDFEKKGYRVKGLYGLKRIIEPFRTDSGGFKYKPKLLWGIFWGLALEITHYTFTKNHPKHSFSLLAVKRLDFFGNDH